VRGAPHRAARRGAAHHDQWEDGEVTVQREGRNAYTRAKRAIEAAKALRAEGFAKDAVRGAIERTKTHVGTTDLSTAQWIEIARRYLAERSGRN
jgi:hypothetical protein